MPAATRLHFPGPNLRQLKKLLIVHGSCSMKPTQTTAETPSDAERSSGPLPDYTPQLAAFHTAFAAELKLIVDSIPLAPNMRVVDVGCGDGFYLGLFAERLRRPGRVTGLDINSEFLKLAGTAPWVAKAKCGVEFLQRGIDDLATLHGQCDLVWCAQSLFSLPEPVQSLRSMAAALQPGGLLAVLENDTLHQLLLPWPSHLEMAVCAAELVNFHHESSRPSKYYVGRRLPAVFAEAGLEPLGFRTQCIDRRAPLDV